MTDATTQIITHDGRFFPGEVFSAAVLQTVYPGATVKRTSHDRARAHTNDPTAILLNAGDVFAPGNDRFDVRDADVGSRANGKPFGLFGIVWQTYSNAYILSRDFETEDQDVIYSYVDDNLAVYVDATEHEAAEPSSVMSFIEKMNPIHGKYFNSQFSAAVRYVQGVLHRYAKHATV